MLPAFFRPDLLAILLFFPGSLLLANLIGEGGDLLAVHVARSDGLAGSSIGSNLRITAATNNAAPIAWDGTDDGLPDGWDAQLERSAEQHVASLTPNTRARCSSSVQPISFT